MGPDDNDAEKIREEELEAEETNNCCEDLYYGTEEKPHWHREYSDGA